MVHEIITRQRVEISQYAGRKGVLCLTPTAIKERYVVVHEFCHFIYPNHSKEFYRFLAMFIPDWKERKARLERCAQHYD